MGEFTLVINYNMHDTNAADVTKSRVYDPRPDALFSVKMEIKSLVMNGLTKRHIV